MRRSRSLLVPGLLLLLAVSPATPGAPAPDFTTGHEVEIFRYEVAPQVVLGQNVQSELSARTPFGELGVDAYLVVVRLAPGQSFVSARAEVKDGFFCLPRRRRAKSLAGRMAARLTYQVVAREVPAAVRDTLAMVSEVLPLSKASAQPPPRLRKRVKLKASNVEHHNGYVAALLLVAANPVTRLQVERVVTRSSLRGGKHRSRQARLVALPDRDQPALPRARIMSILAGEEKSGNSVPP